jgi:mannose-6-phosphate isomerase-like protein (cupin superfamily)
MGAQRARRYGRRMAADRVAHVVMGCTDLGGAVTSFADELGFRLAMIMPADDPSIAELDGDGVRLRLVRRGPATKDEGRAGMRYRDLLPSRLGGRYVVSHIEIARGGPVPDYVHHHHIRFQLIYCAAGWVRVVYEDQGAAFVLRAGDCALQPPGIRHRVLESSPGLEVIEVGSPAEHETIVDHDLTLPTPSLRPERVFGGQRFVRHRAAEATWVPWHGAGLERRDTGIAAATNGLGDVGVVRATGDGAASGPLVHDHELQLWYVLAGTATLRVDDGADRHLTRRDAVVVDAGAVHVLRDCSRDLELLEVAVRP